MRCPRCVDLGAIGADLIGKRGAHVRNSCRALWAHPRAIGARTYVGPDLLPQRRTADGTECSLSGPDLNRDESRDMQACFRSRGSRSYTPVGRRAEYVSKLQGLCM